MKQLLSFFLNPIVLAIVVILSARLATPQFFPHTDYAAYAAEVETLEVISAASLEHATIGQTVLLEGRVSQQNELRFRNFVSYLREGYGRNAVPEGGSRGWNTIHSDTPPLLIEVADGAIQIMNDDYWFYTTAETVKEAEPTMTQGSRQLRGFVIHSPLLALGIVTATADGPAIRAEFIYAGDRSAFLASLRQRAGNMALISTVSLVLFICALPAFIWQMRAFLRESAAAQAASIPQHTPQQPRKPKKRKPTWR